MARTETKARNGSTTKQIHDPKKVIAVDLGGFDGAWFERVRQLHEDLSRLPTERFFEDAAEDFAGLRRKVRDSGLAAKLRLLQANMTVCRALKSGDQQIVDQAIEIVLGLIREETSPPMVDAICHALCHLDHRLNEFGGPKLRRKDLKAELRNGMPEAAKQYFAAYGF